jgi:hypothetical protein
MSDALGNPIELGRLYGYSNQDGSTTHVCVGPATKIHDSGRVSINVQYSQYFLYGEPCNRSWTAVPKLVHIAAIRLFPVEKLPETA